MIGQKMIERLKELQMSQYELAKRPGFSRGYISHLCKRDRGQRVSLQTAQWLAVPLEVDTSFFSKRENVSTQSEVGAELGVQDGECAKV